MIEKTSRYRVTNNVTEEGMDDVSDEEVSFAHSDYCMMYKLRRVGRRLGKIRWRGKENAGKRKWSGLRVVLFGVSALMAGHSRRSDCSLYEVFLYTSHMYEQLTDA